MKARSGVRDSGSAGKGWTLFLGAALLCACAGPAQQVAGIVEVTDPRTSPTLRTPGGQVYALGGEVAEELTNIPGAQVRLLGRVRGNPPEIQAESYLIVDAGQGVMPHVGTLRWNASELVLEQGPGQPVLSLTGEAAYTLRAHIGARVWVVGVIVKDETLQVLNSGILRAPGVPGKR